MLDAEVSKLCTVLCRSSTTEKSIW